MIQDQNLMTGKMMKFVTTRKAPPKGLMAKGRIDVNLCERLVEECLRCGSTPQRPFEKRRKTEQKNYGEALLTTYEAPEVSRLA